MTFEQARRFDHVVIDADEDQILELHANPLRRTGAVRRHT
jgi:hypothetical protein